MSYDVLIVKHLVVEALNSLTAKIEDYEKISSQHWSESKAYQSYILQIHFMAVNKQTMQTVQKAE